MAYNLQNTMEILNSAAYEIAVFCNGGLIDTLRQFVVTLDRGEFHSARGLLSRLNSQLILGDDEVKPRRVSGNVLLDYIFEAIFMSENTFARSAAERNVDDALFLAVQHELSVLYELSRLEADNFYQAINDRVKELNPRSKNVSDTASVIASAAWGGGNIHHVQREQHLQRDSRFMTELHSKLSWDYGEFALRDSYFADEALEEMYRRLFEQEDWERIADDIWNFHSSYGCGKFLKYRNFYFDGELKPLPDLRAGDFVQLAENEYRILLNNAIAFMRDENARPMLLCAGEGMGKTSMMLELTDELPKLRLVLVTGGYEKLPELFGILKSQPLKFMVLLDDLIPAHLAGIAEPLIPSNVLLAACSGTPCLQSLFEITVRLDRPQLNEMVRIVDKLLKAQKVGIAPDTIRSACVDYQVDTRCEFNVASAVRIAELLQS